MGLLEDCSNKIRTLLKNPSEEPSYLSRLRGLLSHLHYDIWVEECPEKSYLDLHILPLLAEARQVAGGLKTGTRLALYVDAILENLQRYTSGLRSDLSGIMREKGLSRLVCSPIESS